MCVKITSVPEVTFLSKTIKAVCIVLAVLSAGLIGLSVYKIKTAAPHIGAAIYASQWTPAIDLPNGKININNASKDELMLLPGIGELLAERIIAYRDESGGFFSKDEIKEVQGIGDGKYEAIRHYITIGASY